MGAVTPETGEYTMTYFITNQHDQAINTIFANGLKIQISRKACVTFSDIHEAERFLNRLQANAKQDSRIKHLKISTYAKGWMNS